MARGTHENEPDTWQQLGLPAELLPQETLCNRADQHQRREENESEKDNDEAVDREIARIEARLAVLNWWEFCLRGYAQRH